LYAELCESCWQAEREKSINELYSYEESLVYVYRREKDEADEIMGDEEISLNNNAPVCP